MSAQSSVVSFNFVAQSVRIVMRGDEPWFVAADVCEALTIANHRDAVTKLDDDEKDGVGIADAIGREQETTIINESGLYSLILTSRKPEAKKFKKWVTSEVLPAIRKTGRYEIPSEPQPTLSAEQWKVIRSLMSSIEACFKWEGSIKFALDERIRFANALHSISALRPEHFEEVKADLEGVRALSMQHLVRMHVLEKEFIAAIIRPPVSIRKVRALARKQAAQPPLTF